jgi:hypothetical protein
MISQLEITAHGLKPVVFEEIGERQRDDIPDSGFLTASCLPAGRSSSG